MNEPRYKSPEDLRQLEHLVPVGFAFLLPYLPLWFVLVLGGVAVLHALYFSPRLIRVTTRQDELQRRFSPGKLYYAVGILTLLLIFHDRLHIVAGVWGILSVGDSASNVIGRRFGRRRLFYNRDKTLEGFAAFWILGGLAGWLLMWWNLPASHFYSPAYLAFCAALTALLCAVGESLPAVIDDNLSILWIGALSLAALEPLFSAGGIPGGGSGVRWDLALAVTLVAAAVARYLQWISWRGAAAASLLGVLVATSLGWEALFALLTFVALGSVATRMGFAHKKKLRISEGEKGQRGIVNVVANGLVPAVIALLAFWSDYNLLAPFTAAAATAALDTVSTEIGQWLGRHPVNPVSLRRVPVGTQGAVSVEGTLAGMVAALIVSLVPVWLGSWPPVWILPVWAGAVTGGFFESINASLFRHPFPWSDEALNLYSTLFGATACVAITAVWG